MVLGERDLFVHWIYLRCWKVFDMFNMLVAGPWCCRWISWNSLKGEEEFCLSGGHWIPLTRVTGPGWMAELSCSGSWGVKLWNSFHGIFSHGSHVMQHRHFSYLLIKHESFIILNSFKQEIPEVNLIQYKNIQEVTRWSKNDFHTLLILCSPSAVRKR